MTSIDWNGTGLPPVGTICERRFPEVRGSSWLPVSILFIGKQRIFYRDEAGDEWADMPDYIVFRPIRTPEQIAAEEREKAIGEIFQVLTGHEDQVAWRETAYRAHAENLYDAGYRKVQP